MNKTHTKPRTLDALQNTLSRRFSVIIFDIDGVLAKHAGTVPDSLISRIVSLLNKQVYVNLVSGRPRFVNQFYRSKGGRDINEVFEQIRNSNELRDSNLLKYLLGFEQNGSVVFDGFDNDDPRKTPHDIHYPAMAETTQQQLWDHLCAVTDSVFSHAEPKSHSIAFWVNEAFASANNLTQVKTTIDHCLSKFGLDQQFEACQTLNTIDVGPRGASKAAAVDFYLRAGFSLQQIARIGDSTYAGGNDRPMIIYQGVGDDGGFSVEHYPELDAFPIVSLPQIINKNGMEATHWLLDHMQFADKQPYVF